MPTAVIQGLIDPSSNGEEETARPSETASLSPTTFRGQDNSTWSGSLLELELQEALQESRGDHAEDRPFEASECSIDSGSVTRIENSRVIDEKEAAEDGDANTTNDSRSLDLVSREFCQEGLPQRTNEDAILSFQRPRLPELTAGPNQKLFGSRYRDAINRAVVSYNGQHSDKKLPVYSQMSPTARSQEQTFVTSLLARLGIGKENDKCRVETKMSLDHDETIVSLDDSQEPDVSLAILSPIIKADLSSMHHSNSVQDEELASSITSLSLAPTSASHKARKSPTCCAHVPRDRLRDNKSVCSSDGSSCTEDIEIPRGANSDLLSPSPRALVASRRRNATTSGKRGMDKVRVRPGTPTSPPAWKDTVFGDSQSPIAPCQSPTPLLEVLSSEDEEDCPRPPNLSWGERVDEAKEKRDDLATSRSLGEFSEDSIEETRITDIGFTSLKAHSVALKEGGLPHLRPLDLRPTKPLSDPLEGYADKDRRRLRRLCDWMAQREQLCQGGVVLSLDVRTQMDVILKVLMRYPLGPKLSRSNILSHVGNTLLVLRTRQECEAWMRFLRAHGSLSVLCHATLSPDQRKSPSTARRCADYDVVVTTYDALKSPDITVQLDEAGRVCEQISQDGWVSRRSDSEVQCKVLSVLHMVEWRRKLLTDLVGRKCYLAKGATARAEACRALRAGLTWALFEPTTAPKLTTLQALIHSDKQALQSVSCQIGSEDDENVQNLLRGGLVDAMDKLPKLT